LPEIELKLLPDEPATQIFARVRKLGIGEGKRVTRKLRTIYYDTADFRLKELGIAFRIRRVGRTWLQTIKARGEMKGGLSEAIEIEAPVRAGRPDLLAIADLELQRTIVDAIGGAELNPVLETAMQRMSQEVRLGDTYAELAFDTGTITVGERSAPWTEIEFELIEGHAPVLFDIVKSLFPAGGLRFSRKSKAARGFMLMEKGIVEEPVAPRNAKDVGARSSDKAEEAALRVLDDCVDQVGANMEAVRLLDDAEGAHQLRVGLRRLRSAFELFGPILRNDEMERLEGEAKWLAADVGRLRDLDACGADVVEPQMKSHPDETELAALRLRLNRRADIVRGEVRATLVSERAQGFLLDLAKFVATKSWRVAGDAEKAAALETPARDFAEAALDRCWKKVRKRAKDIETLEEEQRHSLRKALKKMRYAVESFEGCFSAKRVRPFLKRLKRLQAVFGELNDAVVTRELLADPALIDPASPAHARAAGWMAGATQALGSWQWEHAKELWDDLKETERFWR